MNEISERDFLLKTNKGLNLYKASIFDNKISSKTIYEIRLIFILVRSGYPRVSIILI